MSGAVFEAFPEAAEPHCRRRGVYLLRAGAVSHRGQRGLHRADGAQGHQAEAVAPGLLVAADGADADAQRHDEGHGHGAGGHAAGIKGHSKELLGHKDRQNKDDAVKQHQQPGQRDADEHSQEGKHQKQA